MSKSKNVNAAVINDTAATPATVINEAGTLESLMKQYPNASLRKLALATEVAYGWLLKKSKEPIPGVAYDPAAINYDAVQAVFEKKSIALAELDWSALNEATVRAGGLLTKDMDAYEVGKKVWLREDNVTPFEILYKTGTHIVIMKEGSTEPRSWSHATFLMKGPAFQPRTKGTDASSESC